MNSAPTHVVEDVSAQPPTADTDQLATQRRLRVSTAGFVAILVGAWAGIVPFVGPTFSFSADGSSAWHWSWLHAELWLIPGAAALVGGLLLFGAGASRKARATATTLGGLLTMVSGAWLVLGPISVLVMQNLNHVFATASPMRELEYQIGYSLGPGVLLAIAGALSLGAVMGNRSRVVATMPAARHRMGRRGFIHVPRRNTVPVG
jgi:hypothetical protein